MMPMTSRYKVNAIVACVLIALALWMVSGQLKSSEGPSTVVTQLSEHPVVQARSFTAEIRPYFLRFSAMTEASRKVRLKAEVEGRVEAIEAKDGDMLKKGDTILRLDTREHASVLSEAKARLKKTTIEHQSNKALFKKGLASKTQFVQAQASKDAAKAGLEQAQLTFDNTLIRAPFDGLLEKVLVEVGDVTGSMMEGRQVALLVDPDPFLAVAYVSHAERAQLSVGMKADVLLQKGEPLPGMISFIASVAEENTRAYRVEIAVHGQSTSFVEGASITVHVPVAEQSLHELTSDVLVLDDQGRVGVHTVDDRQQVRFYPIETVSHDGSRLWVKGLPDAITIITVGHLFVKAGQQVTVLDQKQDDV